MWFIYALIGAVGKTYSGFYRKKIAHTVSSSLYIWIANTLILIVLTPFMWSHRSDLTQLLSSMPIVLSGVVITNLLATRLNFEALKREELSYTAPLNAFVPLFTLLIASVFLHESPPRFGLVGVAIIVVGAYVVSIDPSKIHWYSPIQRLTKSAGAQLSIIVTFCYALNTIATKFITNEGFNSLDIFYVTSLLTWTCLLYVPFKHHREFKIVTKVDKRYVLNGSVSAFASGYFHILATASTFTSYATSVRRLDSILSVFLGWKYLKETNILMKILGASIMLIGTLILGLF